MDGEFESKTHLLAILDNMPFMAWYKDDKGKFIAVNQPFADTCGKGKEEIIGKTDFDVWPYELALRYIKDDLEVMNTKKKKSVEEHIEDKTGGIWFETFKSPVFDKDGNVIGTIGMSKDISKRKKIQMELENQKKFIKSMIDAIPDLIFFKDLNGVYLGCNKAFSREVFGLNEEEIIGKTNFELVRDYDVAKMFGEKDKVVLKKQKTTINEERIPLFNGESINVEILKTPFYNEHDEIAGLIGIARNITSRKNFEKKLRESEMRLNLATSNARIGLWDWNIETAETIYNEQWANIIGYSLEELQPLNLETWIKYTHPDDLERSDALLLKHFNGELDYYENEIRLKHKNGQWVWVLDRGKVIQWDSQKNPIRMVGTHIDITERKTIEEELKQKEKILSAAAFSIKELIENRNYLNAISNCFELIGKATQVDRMYLFINTYDDDGIYTGQKLEWNSEKGKVKSNKFDLQKIPFEKINDFILKLKKNKPLYGITSKLESSKMKGFLEERNTLSFILLPIFVENIFWGFIGLDECKYERYWKESEFSTLSAFTNSIGKTIERYLIEAALETSRQNAENADRLKSQFLASMSHEIRTPMHAILGYASLMKDVIENEESMKYLNSIQKAGNILLNLINDILDLSKIEAGKLELQLGNVDIRKLFDDIKEIFSLKIENKNVKIHMKIDPKIPKMILMDEVRIRQILFNLVGNAVKFTEEGSINVSVKVSSIQKKDNLISLTFEVKDTGIGIPEEQQASIFTPFRQREGQNNKKYGGTGLGLSISKRLTDMMKGSLSLISKVGEGSVFRVEIPNVAIANLSDKIDSLEILSSDTQIIKKNFNKLKKEVKEKNTEYLNLEMIEKMIKLKENLWLDCMNKNRVNDIKKFANLILEIGSEYNHNSTMEYAKSLRFYIDSFDLRNTKELLKQYPVILEAYKYAINKK